MKRFLTSKAMWMGLVVAFLFLIAVMFLGVFKVDQGTTRVQAKPETAVETPSGPVEKKEVTTKGLQLMGGPKEHKLPTEVKSDAPDTVTGVQGLSEKGTSKTLE